MVTSSKHRKPAAALIPLIKGLEAQTGHHFSISDAHYDLRRPIYRTQPFRFLDLPAEVREKVYEFTWGTGMGYYFSMRLCYPSLSIRRHHDRGLHFGRGRALLRVNRQMSREAAHILYSQTALQIDSAPYGKPMNLHSFCSVRTRCFTSTTRRICIRSNFSFDTERNKKWVEGLQCFEALLSLEVLLDLDLTMEESQLKDAMASLLPFTALKCERIIFQGPPYIQESTKKAAEAAWQEILEIEQVEAVAVIKIEWNYIHKRSRRALEAQAVQAAQDQ